MTTHATLKSDIASYMARDDLTSTIPTFIRLAESQIRDDVRVRDMETTADVSITARTVSLPTGFLAARRIYLDDATCKELDYYTPDQFWAHQYAGLSGTPEIYTIEGDDISFGPAPGTAVDAKFNYFKAYDALSAESDTNWVLTNHYGIYLSACLAQAKAFIEDDEQISKWATAYQSEVDAMNTTSWKGRFSGSALTRTGHAP